jgi:hypothetical protein
MDTVSARNGEMLPAAAFLLFRRNKNPGFRPLNSRKTALNTAGF